MKPAKDINEIEDELFDQLLEYRTRIYENIASDALSLLSIQLLILPISLSISSLLIEVVSRTNASDTGSAISNIANSLDFFLFQWGIVGGLVSIALTTMVYHFSRKRAADQAYYLIQKHQPDILENETASEDAFDKISRFLSEYFDNSDEIFAQIDNHRQLAIEPNHPETPASLSRIFLSLSLIGTLLSMTAIALALFESIYPKTVDLFTIFIISSVVVMFYFIVSGVFMFLAERAVGHLRKLALLIGRFTFVTAHLCRRGVVHHCLDKPRAASLFLIYPVLITNAMIVEDPVLVTLLTVSGLLFGITGLLLGLHQSLQKENSVL